MSQRFYNFIIVFFCTLSGSAVSAQLSARVDPGCIQAAQAAITSGQAFNATLLTGSSFSALKLPLKPGAQYQIPLRNNRLPVNIVSRDHYIQQLAFFCRQEYRIEKSTRMPFRFRVGSLEQCNLLEGK